MQCVIPENIHTFPTEGIFPKTPTPLEIPVKLPPTPQEIPIPSVGGVWIFSGTAQCYNMLLSSFCYIICQVVTYTGG